MVHQELSQEDQEIEHLKVHTIVDTPFINEMGTWTVLCLLEVEDELYVDALFMDEDNKLELEKYFKRPTIEPFSIQIGG